MADVYNKEPHFSSENILRVEMMLVQLIEQTKAERLLDLGCGTGFIINIAKKYLKAIDGVDVTQAMLDKIVRNTAAQIRLFCHDTGTFEAEKESYDLVTGYSFLHHLYDIRPTINTAYEALRVGGKFYSDLDPNFYFWDALNSLQREGNYDPMVKREIEMVTYKDEDVAKNFNVSKETFNQAEYGKNVKGGFREEEIRAIFKSIGFREVNLCYHWFLGQRELVNDEEYAREDRMHQAEVMDHMLKRALPLSRHLFKYIGVVATK
jgi:SAM-dependent methyltransferase